MTRVRFRVMTTTTNLAPPDPDTGPRRTVRISDELWELAQAESLRRGETRSTFVRRALRECINREGRDGGR